MLTPGCSDKKVAFIVQRSTAELAGENPALSDASQTRGFRAKVTSHPEQGAGVVVRVGQFLGKLQPRDSFQLPAASWPGGFQQRGLQVSLGS